MNLSADSTVSPADNHSFSVSPHGDKPSPSTDPIADGRVVTVVSSTHGQRVGKEFSLVDGAVKKGTEANYSEYNAQSVAIADLAALQRLLATLTPSQYIILGCIPEAGFTPYRLNSEGWFEKRKAGCGRIIGPVTAGGVIRYGRFKENFQACRYALIDRDFNSAMPDTLRADDAGFAAQMDLVWPGFASAGKLIIGSSSNRVLRNGAPVNSSPSQHIYVELDGNWRDWDQLRTRLDARAINAGLGFPSFSKAGAVLKRAIFDISVFSLSRPVFEGAPLVHAPLTLAPPSFAYIPGPALAVPDPLEVEERTEYRRLSGNIINDSGRKLSVSNSTVLTLDTVIETKSGMMTVAQYQASAHGKLRCQTPFRDSSSWNGILNRTDDGRVFVHDNGASTTFWLAESVAPPLPDTPDLPDAMTATAALTDALSGFFDKAAGGQRGDLGVKGAAGLGKSTLADKLAVERLPALLEASEGPVAVVHYLPTVKSGRDLAARLPEGTAVVIRGRTHGLEMDGSGDEEPPCKKAESAKLLNDAGFGRLQQRLLCGRQDAAGNWDCPHSAGCEYHAQFKTGAPIEFRTHQWLTIGKNDDSGDSAVPAVAIVDEDPSAVFEDVRTWSLSDCAEAGGVFNTIAQAIKDGTLNRDDHFELIKDELELQPAMDTPMGIRGKMDKDTTRRELSKWMDRRKEAGPREPWGLLRKAFEVVQTGAFKRLYAWQDKHGATQITYAGLKTLQARGLHWLFLDASMNADIVQTIRPEIPLIMPSGDQVRAPVSIMEIAARRNATFIQIRDTALSMTRLGDNAGHLDQRIAEFLDRLAALNPNGAFISTKEFEAIVTGNGCPVPSAHFRDLRGMNRMEDADWLAMVGRFQTPSRDIERRARCWFADRDDFQPGTERRQRARLDADNEVTVTGFADRYCQSILEMVREQESLQGIDRLRLVHCTKPKTVFILSNQPLPGIRPDKVVDLADLLLPGRLAVVMRRDKAITGAAMLALRHPDLFETVKEAEHVLAGASIPRFPINRYIGERGIEEGLQTVTYRTAKQAGGKPRKAVVQGTADPESILTSLHGESVKAVTHVRQESTVTTRQDQSIPIPIPIPPKEPQPMGNLTALFGPEGFIAGDANLPEDEADEFATVANFDTDDRDVFTAPIIAGLIADGWHPVNAKARADEEWIWRYGPPRIAGGLLMQRATANTNRGSYLK